MGKIIKLAQEMWDQFEQASRDDGSKFWRLKEGAPEWMKDVCRAAHDGGKIMPDDFRYEFITDSLIKITENDEDTDDDDLDSVDFEGDVYNSDLAKWLGAGGDRWWYCDQALKDPPSDFSSLLQTAQVMEKEEVYGQVLEALREHADTLDDDEDDTEEDEDQDTEEEVSS